MKASLAGGGSCDVEKAGPTTEGSCRAVDSTDVQGLWPCRRLDTMVAGPVAVVTNAGGTRAA